MRTTSAQPTSKAFRDPAGPRLAILATMLVAAAGPLVAQESGRSASVQSIEARLVRSGSVHSRLGSPTGLGVTARVGVERPVHLMVGYRFRDGGASGILLVCGPIPETGCEADEAEWDFDLHSAEIGIGHARRIGETAAVRLAVSGVWTRIGGKVEQPGAAPRDLGREGQLGLSLMTGAERSFGSLAVFADGRFENTWCGKVADGSLPCENYWSLEVGVAYRYASSP